MSSEYKHNHYQDNKKKYAENHKKWVLNHQEEIKLIKKRYRDKPENKLKARIQERKVRLSWKTIVFDHYTNGKNTCQCYDESIFNFLTVDHIHGGGNQERKSGKYHNVYKYLIDNNFPDGFQILCMNCNFAKGKFGQCPHRGEA